MSVLKPQMTIVDNTYRLFSVVFIWSLMVGAFIDYAVSINTYIERISGIGGLTDVPNSSQQSSVLKDSPVTKAAASAASAVKSGAAAVGKGVADAPLSAIKRMASRGAEDKIREQIGSYKEGNGFFGFGATGIAPTTPSGNGSGGGSGNGSGGAGAAMGGVHPTQAPSGSGGGMNPYSPAADNSKQAGIYSLMNQSLSGKQAKKQMAEAMKGQKGFMDPYGEGKDYVDQLKQSMGKEDQKKLDNSLVFDAGNDGMQIMSDIESDGNGKISASMNGENIELYSQSADADVGGNVGNYNASTEIGGVTFMYDADQCPTFHKMMGGVDLYGDLSGAGSPSGTGGSSSSGGSFGGSSSSGMGGSSSSGGSFGGSNSSGMGGSSSSGGSFSKSSSSGMGGPSGSGASSSISGHQSGPRSDPKPSNTPNPKGVNPGESDIELF